LIKKLKLLLLHPRKGEIIRNYSDITQARKLLGFKSNVSFTKSVEEIKNVEVLSRSE